MKRNLVITFSVLLVLLTCAFVLRARTHSLAAKPRTIVSVHTFTPYDKSKPVVFLGAYVQSFKEDGSFVDRQISATGKSVFFYSDGDATYRTNHDGTERVGAFRTKTFAEVEAGEAGMANNPGFKRVDTIHGLKLNVIESVQNGKRLTDWMSYQYGPLQSEREMNDGIEQIKIVSVTEGYDPAEFAKIPPR